MHFGSITHARVCRMSNLNLVSTSPCSALPSVDGQSAEFDAASIRNDFENFFSIFYKNFRNHINGVIPLLKK